jgi:hypothetical protein
MLQIYVSCLEKKEIIWTPHHCSEIGKGRGKGLLIIAPKIEKGKKMSGRSKIFVCVR